MRVALVERFGSPEWMVTTEAPDPVAGPGQVVVAGSAADVLFLETVVRHPQEANARKVDARKVTVRGIEQAQFAPADVKRLVSQALAEAGRIRPVIGQTFPLERAAEAHAAIEARDVVATTLLVI